MEKNQKFNKICADLLVRVRDSQNLIHHITNFVVMNDTANVTLALGGLPVMSQAKEEVAEMVSAAGALLLNPGTLTPEGVEAMLIAGKRANELGIPIIYDPVGVGATKLRNETGERFLTVLQLAAVRGNSGEVGALAGAGGIVKGVESVEGVKDPAQVASDLAQKYHTIVAITGERDFISDGKRVLAVDNGHPMLKTITGTGCMATTAVAVFCSVERDFLLASAAALACYGLAAQNAAQQANGPGTFRSALLDALYNLRPEQVEDGVRIIELQGEET